MVDLNVVVSLFVAALIYGNLSLILAAEVQHVSFALLFIVAIVWSTSFTAVFILFINKIVKFFSRFAFFKKWLALVKEKAKKYPKHSLVGVILASIIPFPPCGLYCGSIVGLSLGFSKLETFAIVWLSNLAQFLLMYLVIGLFI
jgi:uncharacterized membrane protein